MADWKQTQQQQWQNNPSENASEDYTDEEYTDDDDEYEPIEATAWGSQSIGEDGATNVSLTVSGWQSLIDPNIKTKAGGVGSGQLHRRGANYQPVDEQSIIDRRLGKPVPKGGLGGSKKKKPKRPKGPAGPPPPRKPKGPAGPPPPRRPVPSSLVPPSSSAYRGRETITTGPWGSAQLSSTPFWEQPANKASNGSMASKYASAPSQAASRPPPVQAPAPAPKQASAPKQAPEPFQFRQPAPAAAVPAPSRPAAPPLFGNQGSAASKYATPAAAAPAPAPQQQYQQPPQPVQQPPVPTISFKLEQPIINVKVEVGEGTYVKLPVYANEPATKAVQRFETEHSLHFDQYQKENVKMFIEYHVNEYRKRKLAESAQA